MGGSGFNRHAAGKWVRFQPALTRWTGPKLVERLENQLCGEYLRDPRSRRGLFVLVHNGTEKAWTVADGSRVDFDGLVEMLTARWRLEQIAFRWNHMDA